MGEKVLRTEHAEMGLRLAVPALEASEPAIKPSQPACRPASEQANKQPGNDEFANGGGGHAP